MRGGLPFWMVAMLVSGSCASTSPMERPAHESAPDRGPTYSRPLAPRPEWHAEVQTRTLLGIRCLMPCEPEASFAAGWVGWDEHGAGGGFAVRPEHCAYPGFGHPVDGCTGYCDAGGYLAELSISYRGSPNEWREPLCRVIVAHRGSPDEGACDDANDVIWHPGEEEPRIRLYPGVLSLECGAPGGAFLPLPGAIHEPE
jgi:hypothetical protein